ncbi:MAG: alpha-N-acetylglucosaminidase C-terminal domain-containing protein [Clostridium sp.]|nr:alpha-N-acetylglucosaminidase C-terminal domain-containing protein [Clostridium sp.]
MRKRIHLLCMLLVGAVALRAADTDAVVRLLERIGGAGTAERFELVVDKSLAENGKDVFVIAPGDGKPCIKGNTVLSLSTGVNWYLNHVAHVNLAWNQLTTDLSSVALPVPDREEKHVSTADYRYYLNYCTFSYSMAFWTWERWEQEIDWMALRGINMPLALVGADVVWRNVLLELGYTDTEINDFVAGPGFQAWWLMNNMEGWGGPNKSWWYERQEKLAKNILTRMRELGMTPVLPGYSGMAPSNVSSKLGWQVSDPGSWCYFRRPAFIVPTSDNFTRMAELYYKHLEALMGVSPYYSMDPFHEGGNTSGVDLPAAYTAIQREMDKVNPDAKWVIQSWNENPRRECLQTIKPGKLVVLDLFSDGTPKWGNYGEHEFVYCMLHNFGGRVGMHGRLAKTMDGYHEAMQTKPACMKGVGATPEGIETNPVLYDALFELPWRSQCTADEWLAEYVKARYGTEGCTEAAEAWALLNRSAYNCQTGQQGTTEPVICARPNLTVNSVSTWSSARIYYDKEDIIQAAARLLKAKEQLSGVNYRYDLVDVVRQAVTDRANGLLKQVKAAYDAGDKSDFQFKKDQFLQLILDQDRLLATCPEFRLGRWTQMARDVTDEAVGASGDKNWMEWNARTQITVWGPRSSANSGGLHDYSNREWSGLLKDFHYERWKTYFDNLTAGTAQPDWFAVEEAWTKDYTKQYTARAEGDAVAVAQEVFDRYFARFGGEGDAHYFAYGEEADMRATVSFRGWRGEAFTSPVGLPDGVEGKLSVDLNNNGLYDAGETFDGLTFAVPKQATTAAVRALLTLTDSTKITFTLVIADRVTEPRTVTVKTADAGTGTVAIRGAEGNSITTMDDVTLTATAAAGYDFTSWTNAAGEVVSRSATFTYYGKADETFTAHFLVNKWGQPEENKSEWSTINDYQQYVSEMTFTRKGQEAKVIYTTSACPENLFVTVPEVVDVARGGSFRLDWQDPNGSGLSYCRLSAYIDLDNDGEFTGQDELVALMGNKNTTNPSLSKNGFRILLPLDMPVGLTHVRLRFDGAWTGGWDSVTDAKPAKAATVRMVYDVLVNVTEHAATPVQIQAKSANELAGTATISGRGDETLAQPGERIILQAQPQNGYRFDHWEDEYGRTVSTEANYSFVPAESGVFTAYFRTALPDVLTLGDWKVRYTEQNGAITLTEAVEGTGALVIPETYSEGTETYPIVALGADFLSGNEEVTSLSLPSSVVDLGVSHKHTIYRNAWNGEGTTNRIFTPESPIPGNEEWTLYLEAVTDGSSFNTWGSGLLATGSDALASSYNGGFQFYWAKNGNLVVKFAGESDKKEFGHTAGSGSLSVVMHHGADGRVTLTVTNVAGASETYERNGVNLNDITQFSSSIPAGVNVTELRIDQPGRADALLFGGCTRLQRIDVDKANAAYSSTDGVLYDAAGKTLLRCPEGRTVRALSLPETLSVVGSNAFCDVRGVERIVPAEALPETEPNAFLRAELVCEVTPQMAASCPQGWEMPLLVTVAGGQTAESEGLDGVSVVEIQADDFTSGALDADKIGASRWYTRAFGTERFYPIYFPADVTETVAVTDNEYAGVNIADHFVLYTYDGTSFVKADVATGTTVLAGAYLLALQKGAASVFTFRMDGAQIGDAGSVFTGNGSLARVTTDEYTYLYTGASNRFVPAGFTGSVAPFVAFMRMEDSDRPDYIPGVDDTQVGISATESSVVAISVTEHTLWVTGPVCKVAVYAVSGETVYRGEPGCIVLPSAGVYVVEVDGKRMKLSVN